MIPTSELSSLASALDELAGRLSSLVADLPVADREDIGPDLYEVERTLSAASRRLGKVVDAAR